MAIPVADIARTAAVFALTGVIVRWLMGRYLAWRRRSQNGREWQDYKGKLAGWVKTVEMLTALAFYIALFFLWLGSIPLWHHGPGGTRVGIFIFAGLFGFVAPALMLANAVSYAIPPMRRANFAAFEGLETPSFASANLGLLKFGAFVTLPALLVAAGTVFWPG